MEATEPEEIDASAPEADDTSEEETPGDDVETTEEVTAEAVEPPTWWDAEQRAIWATLTPAQQAAVAEQEAKRETVTAKAKEEAAAARKQAEAEAQQANNVLNALASEVPKWVATFKSQWDGVDWPQLARDYPPEQYNQWRAEYEAQKQQIEQAQQTQELAQIRQQEAFYKERAAQLPTIAPELVDPVKGEANQTELSQYLLKAGFDAETIRGADARMMAIAWKALKADRALQSITAKPKPAAPKPNVAPAAAAPRTSQVRSIEQHSARLAKSGSVEDAVALLQARRK